MTDYQLFKDESGLELECGKILPFIELAYNTYVTVDAINYGLLPGGVKPVNPFANNVSNIARAKKKWKKLGD